MDKKYEKIFHHAPIGIWEEDWTQFLEKLLSIKNNPLIIKIEDYLEDNPNIVLDLLGSIKITNINDQALKIYESASKEEIQKNFIKTFNSERINFFKKRILSYLNGEDHIMYETKITTLKGNICNALINIEFPLNNESNAVIAMIDITNTIKNYNNYIGIKNKLNQYFQDSVIGLLIIDETGNILHFNKSLKNMIKFNQDEILNININDIIVNKSIFYENLSLLLSNKEASTQFDIKLIDKNNKEIWTSIGITTVNENDSQKKQFMLQIVNINDKKETQFTLEENVYKYQQLLDSTNTIYLILDNNGFIKDYSKTFLYAFNINPNSKDYYQSIHEEHFRSFVCSNTVMTYDLAFKKIMAGQTVTNTEICILNNNITKWFNMNASMLRNGEIKIFILLTDMTEKKTNQIKININNEKRKDKLKSHIKNFRHTIQEEYGVN
jgi:PAS domain S-box-containing protein